MNTYRADLHTHTVLSPCADLFMSPRAIIEAACKRGIDILGITDHNSTRQASVVAEMGKKQGVFVLQGAEITTKEEAHCLAFMPGNEQLEALQAYLDEHLPDIKNNTDKFGFQVAVDVHENIVFEEPRLLISGINRSIEQIEAFVHQRGGIFIPAHVNRSRYSIISQLGFVPPDLNVDALEVSRHISIDDFKKQNRELQDYSFIQSSDAHFIDDVGRVYTNLLMQNRSFDEVKMALAGENGRGIQT